jgi:osmoprotectant transport system ATP-binding protein
MIRLEAVTKEYPDGHVAVHDVSFEVPAGKTLCLIGTSGCGKTTTLKLINRLLEPTRGRILVNGRDVMEQDPILLRRGIGYAIQKVGLLPHRTVADNIALLMELEKWPRNKIEARVNELLSTVGLEPEDYANRFPIQLSGGEQQRVGVARALALDPPVILMDEPFGALDPITRETLQDEFLHLQQTVKKTIVIVTHDLNEAFKLGDFIGLMHKGAMMDLATPAAMLRWSADSFVGYFVRKHLAKLPLDVLPAADAIDRSQEGAEADPKLPADASIKDVLDLFLRTPTASRVRLGESGVVTRDSLMQSYAGEEPTMRASGGRR